METKPNILVIDPDSFTHDVFEVVAKSLKSICNIHIAVDFRKSGGLIEKHSFEIVLINISLPDINSFEACRYIREISNTTNAYIIMAAGQLSLPERIKAYDCGVQSFVFKPFDIKELESLLTSKINFIRKINFSAQKENELITVGKFCLDTRTKKIIIEAKEVKLTKMEFNLLKFLMLNPEKFLEINTIAASLWKDQSAHESVRALIYRLRSKIELDPKEPVHLVSSKNNGYIFYPFHKQ